MTDHRRPARTRRMQRGSRRTPSREAPPARRARGALAALSLFWQGALLSYIALFRWLRPPTYLASKIIMPLAQMAFFAFVGSFGSAALGFDWFVIGNAMQIAAVSGIYGVTMSIGGDRWMGTLPYLFGTPANRLVMFFGRSALHILDGMLGVVVAFGWGALLFGLSLAAVDPVALALVVLVTVFATSALGLLMGGIGLITRNVMFVNNSVYFLLLLFSGANVPLERMPGWMRTIAAGLPLTNGIAAAREIVAGAAAATVAPYLLRELAIGGTYLLAGFLLFRGLEVVAKRSGSLETV